ncbi:type VI secretion system baseplate subunit TssG [Prosthecobacter sp. SYSU 5D2]|uniref:type VI secretion system baseplate subunit TssG n=1 Tax=Prosthecobacter sp. SYSU 5D2 TaxID=3134134 RepID=UPI0031FE660C
MASPGREDPHRLIQELCAEPWKYDFFQGLRAIECAFEDKPRIGRSRTLRDDPLRFGQLLSLSFATSTLAQPQLENQAQKLTVRFMGLTGPHGPLPLRLTEFMRNRLRGIYDSDIQGTAADIGVENGVASPRDSTLAEFIDIFHHRMISLFYRAWAVSQKTVDFDREEDRFFAEWIACLFGTGLPEMDGLDSIPTWQKLPFAGHLANQTRHSSGLEGVLADAFATRAEVLNLTGHWVTIPADQRCYLGRSRALGTLGQSCVVGSVIWDRHMKFSVLLGPMSLSQFETFAPGGSSHQPLHDWIAFYTRREFYWEASILLKKEEVPKISLGQTGRLGYTTWLSSLPFKHDPGDYHIRGGGLTPAENS